MACPLPPQFFAAMPNPFQPPGLIGNTKYHYLTRGGGPPSDGKPPSAPASSAPPPPYSPFAPFGPPPPQAQPMPFMLPPQNGHPGAYCVPNAPAPTPAGPGYYYAAPPAPPAPPARAFTLPIPPPPVAPQAPPRASTWPEPPVSGNRIDNKLVHLQGSGGVGYIASKHQLELRVFNCNIIDGCPPSHIDEVKRLLYVGPPPERNYTAQYVSFYMPLEELIEQLDCIKMAHPQHPRNRIGLTQIEELQDGWFSIGSELYLGDFRCQQSLKDLWNDNWRLSIAGNPKPIYLVRRPGKPAPAGGI